MNVVVRVLWKWVRPVARDGHKMRKQPELQDRSSPILG